MAEHSPWRTPFGRLLIVSSIGAAILGSVVAAGVAGYFNNPAAAPFDTVPDTVAAEPEAFAQPDYDPPSEPPPVFAEHGQAVPEEETSAPQEPYYAGTADDQATSSGPAADAGDYGDEAETGARLEEEGIAE